jgi:hypothetical protein
MQQARAIRAKRIVQRRMPAAMRMRQPQHFYRTLAAPSPAARRTPRSMRAACGTASAPRRLGAATPCNQQRNHPLTHERIAHHHIITSSPRKPHTEKKSCTSPFK